MSEEKPKQVTAPTNFKEFADMKDASIQELTDATLNDLMSPDEPIPIIIESLDNKQVWVRIPRYKDFQVVYKASQEDQFRANVLLINRCVTTPKVTIPDIEGFRVGVIIEIVKHLNRLAGADEDEVERAKNSQEEMDQVSGD